MTQITRRLPAQEIADKAERDRRSKAYTDLHRSARLVPGPYSSEKIASRSGIDISVVERVLNEYANAPHVHGVRTLHLFGGACRLGREHDGCCPRTRGCDAPGQPPAEPS